ncbi:uncharacterized protein LOC135695390 [Rhopilema esculentum]|uniref:uncharacterized protein LOC135695390 n=1 Tax=Rhopilema esculentum TaxID=499914 RepID=UPI0031DEAEFB
MTSFPIFLCFLEFFAYSGSVRVIYESGVPKIFHPRKEFQTEYDTNSNPNLDGKGNQASSQTKKVKKIVTKDFLVNIKKSGNSKASATVKQLDADAKIDLGLPLVREISLEDKSIVGEHVPDNLKETLKNVLTREIVRRLSGGNVGIFEGDAQKEETNNVIESPLKKRKLTEMFVRYMEHLANKLKVDVVTVAEQLISRSGETEAESTMGFTRNIIPAVPSKFRSILKTMSRIINTELASAVVLKNN